MGKDNNKPKSTMNLKTGSKANNIHEELENLLREHPKTEFLDILIPDSCGILRGKRIFREEMANAIEKGIRMPTTLFALDTTGRAVYIEDWNWLSSDSDLHCKTIPNTLVSVPWHKKPSAQVLMSMYEEDGSPFFGDPRHVLAKMIDKLKLMGLTAVTSVEMEFYLIDTKRTPHNKPKPLRKMNSKRRDYSISVYSVDDVDEQGDFIDEVIQTSKIQGVSADKAISEEAPGQFEINLHHLPDPLRACDEAILLKRIVKQTAKKYGMQATFMAKPYENFAGSGMHIHVSVIDEAGKNIFNGNIQKQGLKISEKMLHSIGGLQKMMSDSMLMVAPNMNSYRRYQATSYVADSNSWAVNNRTVALRLPSGVTEDVRIEYRIAGADSNPYLVMSAVLAGIHYGLENKIKPTEPVEGDAHFKIDKNLPTDWVRAIDAFKNSKIMPMYLGADFARLYHTCRATEYERSSTHIHPIEYDWYINSI